MPDHEEDILARAVRGDREAVAELLRLHGPQVRARLTGRIASVWQSVLDIDDVLQVTYLEAFLRIGAFSPSGPGSFLAWLTQIAQNNLRDAVKSLERAKRPNPRQRVQPSPGADSYVALVELLGVTNTTPSRQAAKGEMKTALDAALERLPPDYGAAIREYDLKGRPIAEVASNLRRSEGAVYMLLARAHDKLREVLGSESQFFSQAP